MSDSHDSTSVLLLIGIMPASITNLVDPDGRNTKIENVLMNSNDLSKNDLHIE